MKKSKEYTLTLNKTQLNTLLDAVNRVQQIDVFIACSQIDNKNSKRYYSRIERQLDVHSKLLELKGYKIEKL